MSIRSNLLLSSFLFSILASFLGTAKTDEPCPYPCYTLPTGYGSTPTTPSGTIATTPSPPSQSLYQPPTGYFPYNPPPAFGGSGGGGGAFSVAPPPPDPILPYFPFYYRKPPHQTNGQSPSSAVGATLHKWTALSATTSWFSCVFHFIFYIA